MRWRILATLLHEACSTRWVETLRGGMRADREVPRLTKSKWYNRLQGTGRCGPTRMCDAGFCRIPYRRAPWNPRSPVLKNMHSHARLT